MAHLIPADISKLELADSENPEHETLAVLHAGLSDEYSVFHSVHWSRNYERYTVFGEIDFVIVNQSGDVLLIEQKNGKLEETDQGLVKWYGSDDKSVVGQMNRSLNQIRNKFQFLHGKSEEPSYSFLLYCPDYRVKNVNAAGLDEDCIVDATSKAKLSAIVKDKLGVGTTNEYRRKRAVDFFAQSFNFVVDIHAREAGLNKRYRELASNLAEVIRNLELNPYRLRVSGTAGSGKSLLAAEYYCRQLEQGKRVLFLCFNRPLADQLRSSLPEGGIVNTWLGFLQDVLADHGLQETPDGTNDFWDRRLEAVVDSGVDDKWKFDCLIVDEGQDFEELWWMVLKENCMSEDPSVLWLEDPDQNVRGIDWQQREFPATFHARTNFRSPYRIAQHIQETLPFEFEVGNGLRGLGVGEQTVSTPKELKDGVDKLVKKWLSEGFTAEDIVVLTCVGLTTSSLFHPEKLGNRLVRKFTGEYMNGDQVYSDGVLRFDSVRRFKGQQAPVVILTDVDVSEGEKLLDRQRIVFTGMTRATMRLEVIHGLVK
jgi:hypothetical protein